MCKNGACGHFTTDEGFIFPLRLPFDSKTASLANLLAPLYVQGGKLVRLRSGIDSIAHAYDLNVMVAKEGAIPPWLLKMPPPAVRKLISLFFDTGLAKVDEVTEPSRRLSLHWGVYCLETVLVQQLDIKDDNPFEIPVPNHCSMTDTPEMFVLMCYLSSFHALQVASDKPKEIRRLRRHLNRNQNSKFLTRMLPELAAVSHLKGEEIASYTANLKSSTGLFNERPSH